MDGSLATLMGVALGVGLAAATGFRVFPPLLVAAIAARAEWIPLNAGFQWLEATPVLIALGTAALVETLAYFIPGVDHLLDLLAGPAAVAAGVVVSASVMVHVPPSIMWPVAIIAGGSVAGLTKGSAALLRAKISLATAGLGNPLVSALEVLGATGVSILAIVAPVLCLIVVIALLIWTTHKAGRLLFRWRADRKVRPR
jgi:Domain of unknown function (DUF4126)